ncbi:MAG: FHA domain-containing protein [Planctomycetes bacterium]|nr:FHA domain-containing protein [Planctomycetota bacterium]
MAWLMVKLQSGKERGHELLDDVTFVGSAEDCEIRVAGGAPKHCQILKSGANLKLIDLGSPDGTLVNGQKVKDKVLLDGDVVQVGTTQLAFKAGGSTAAPRPAAAPAAPAAAAPAPRPAPAARPAAPVRAAASSSSARRPSRATAARGGRRGRDEEEEEGEETGSSRAERRLTRGSGRNPMMTVGISIVSLGILIFVMVKALGSGDDVRERIAKAESLAANNNVDLAIAEIDAVLKGVKEGSADHVSAKVVRDRILEQKNKTVQVHDERQEDAYFFSNLKPFYDMYIDDKSKAFKGKDYLNDPATARYFVEERLEYYLTRFPTGANIGTVKAWAESLKRRYNAADPFPRPDVWWDTEIIATFESKLEHYGRAYVLRKRFRDNNPNYKNLKDVDEEVAYELRQATNYAKAFMSEINRSLDGAAEKLAKGERATVSTNYATALSKAIRAANNLAGIPDMVAEVKAAGQKAIDASKAAGFPFAQAEIDKLNAAGTETF